MYSIKIEENNFKQIAEELISTQSTYFYSPNSIAYETEYFQNKVIPLNLVLRKRDVLLGTLYYTIDDERICSYFNRPIKVFWNEGATKDDRFELYQLLLNFFEKKLESKEFAKIMLASDLSLFAGLQKFKIKISSFYESIVSLECSEEIIKRSIRKSYRSLINWGTREMQFIRVDQNNPNFELFETFRLFHINVAGRETRSKKSWDLQFKLIKEGKCILELGYYQDQLVSGVLSLLGNEEAYYGVAVNDRELMALKKPIGHAIMLRTILHSKSLGIKVYNLGYTGPDFSNDKEAEIGKYKRGLSSEMRICDFFEVTVESK